MNMNKRELNSIDAIEYSESESSQEKPKGNRLIKVSRNTEVGDLLTHERVLSFHLLVYSRSNCRPMRS